MTDDADSIDLGGVDFVSYAEWIKDVEINPNDENLSEVCFGHFFCTWKGILNWLMSVIFLEDHVTTAH